MQASVAQAGRTGAQLPGLGHNASSRPQAAPRPSNTPPANKGAAAGPVGSSRLNKSSYASAAGGAQQHVSPAAAAAAAVTAAATLAENIRAVSSSFLASRSTVGGAVTSSTARAADANVASVSGRQHNGGPSLALPPLERKDPNPLAAAELRGGRTRHQERRRSASGSRSSSRPEPPEPSPAPQSLTSRLMSSQLYSSVMKPFQRFAEGQQEQGEEAAEDNDG